MCVCERERERERERLHLKSTSITGGPGRGPREGPQEGGEGVRFVCEVDGELGYRGVLPTHLRHPSLNAVGAK